MADDQKSTQAPPQAPDIGANLPVGLFPGVGAAPATVAPTQSPTDDYGAMVREYMQKGTQAIENQRALGAQQAAVPLALSWRPQFQNVRAIPGTPTQPAQFGGEGIGGVGAGQPGRPEIPGHGATGFLHNLGQALLAVGAATRPGRAIETITERPRMQARAQEIAGLQAEEKPEEEAAGLYTKGAEAMGMLGYRQGMLGVQQQRNEILQQRADAYSQNVANRLQVALKGLDLRAISVGSQVELNKARTALDQVMPQILEQRNALVGQGIDVRAADANMMAQLGINKEHPLFNLLDSWLGTGLTPSAPQAPQGAQPVTGATPPPTRAPAAGKGGRYVEGNKTYNIPAGMEKEFLKDHPNAKRQ